MILAQAMLWTIFWHGHPVPQLQYQSLDACLMAIQEGLPYSYVPPKAELSCGLFDDTNPVIQCSDGSIAYLAHGEFCRYCFTIDGDAVTSTECIEHGYKADDRRSQHRRD